MTEAKIDGIANSVDMSLSELREWVMDSRAAFTGSQNLDTTERLN